MADHDDFEHLVDRHLKALPSPRAPRTLLPAVLAAARARAARPWYARPWRSWPIGWRAASAALLLAMVAGGVFAAATVPPQEVPVLSALHDALAPAARVVVTVETLATVVEVLRRVIGQSVIGLVVALFVVMLTTSLVVGAAIGRLALGGAHQS